MNLLDLILVSLELGQYSIMYTGISVLFILCLFSQFCLVFLYLVSLVGRLLGYTWEYDVASPWWGGPDGSFFVGNEMWR